MLLINHNYLHKAVLSLSKWYKSDIVGLYVGKFRVAVVHNGEGVRELLNNQACDGRPALYLSRMRDPGDGVRGGLRKSVIYPKGGIHLLIFNVQNIIVI